MVIAYSFSSSSSGGFLTPASSDTPSSSMVPGSHSYSASNQTALASRKPVLFISDEHNPHEQLPDLQKNQSFTFTCPHDTTSQSSTQISGTHPKFWEDVSFKFELPVDPIRPKATPFGRQASTRNVVDDKFLLDQSTASTAKRDTGRPLGAPNVSMQLFEPSGMIEPVNTSLGMSIRNMRLSDVSIATEDGTTYEPYDVKNETAPEEPYFSLSFQETLRNSLTLANEATVAISTCAKVLNDDDHLRRLCADATALSSFQGSDTRTIAILGDSGEGKSSLINSLLHYSEIARTGDAGSACTSVVTEYRQKRPNQMARMVLEVEYLSTAQITDLIKELLWNYRKFYLPHVRSNQTGADDYARWQKESEQAWSALESAFKHKQSFSEEFLNDASNGAADRIAARMVSWANEIQWPDGSKDGIWSSTAEDAEDCCTKTSLFMKDQFWPFTKVIRIFLDAQVLRTGVVLADLPGLHDTNLARVRTTQEYLMKCDLFLIVANIARAITNESLKSSLHTVLSRHMPMEWEDMSSRKKPNFAFVCTMTENMNVETEKRDFCGPDKPISASVMRQLDDQIDQAKREGHRERKKELKRKQEIMLVDARNNHVKRHLQEIYSTRVSSGHLEVFCVSNAWYKKYTRKGNESMVRASGIPDLRRFCYTVTAQAQLLEAQNFLQAKLQGLLISADLWATNRLVEFERPLERSLIVLEVTPEAVREKMMSDIEDAESGFLNMFDDMLSQYFSLRVENWISDACNRHEKWSNWHWSQYNAWCMNNGRHATPRRLFVDWNAEIIWKMRSELALPWQMLEEEVSGSFNQLLSETEELFQCLNRTVQSDKSSTLISKALDFHIKNLRYQTSVIKMSFMKELDQIHRCTFEPCGNSYVLGEMLAAYRAAARESGGEKAVRQQQHVRGKIEDEILFPNVAFKIRSSMEPLVDKIFSDVKELFRSSLGSVENDISATLSSQKSPTVAASGKEVDAVKQLAISIEALRKRHAIALRGIENF